MQLNNDRCNRTALREIFLNFFGFSLSYYIRCGEFKLKETGLPVKMRRNGFSMLELIIVIGIISILATLITPLAVNYITQQRYNACNEELQVLKKAIVGDASLVEGGTRSSFGFVGDLGSFPRNLSELIANPGPPDTYPTYQLQGNVWAGWRGPYVSEIKDPWGNDYQLYTNWVGKQGTQYAKIESGGSDPASTSDDVSIIIRYDEIFSMVSGNTLDPCGAGAAFDDIEIFYPQGGTVISSGPVDTNTTTPHFNIQLAIPIGVRYIQVGAPQNNKMIYINNGPLTVVNLKSPGVCN